MYEENWYFNNKRTSISCDMVLNFSKFHHHIELFDYLIYLISKRIQECNFCSMHCSFVFLHSCCFYYFSLPIFSWCDCGIWLAQGKSKPWNIKTFSIRISQYQPFLVTFFKIHILHQHIFYKTTITTIIKKKIHCSKTKYSFTEATFA